MDHAHHSLTRPENLFESWSFERELPEHLEEPDKPLFSQFSPFPDVLVQRQGATFLLVKDELVTWREIARLTSPWKELAEPEEFRVMRDHCPDLRSGPYSNRILTKGAEQPDKLGFGDGNVWTHELVIVEVLSLYQFKYRCVRKVQCATRSIRFKLSRPHRQSEDG